MLLPHPFKSFVVSEKGVSALEFALILPIMMTLYLGGIEIGDALTINRKVTHVTSALADLITQAKTISNADMDNILDAAAAVVTPYSDTLLRIKVTEAVISAAGVATVVWSDARHDTAYAPGAAITIPAAVRTPSTWIVTAEVHYQYTPTIGYVMTGNFDLNDKFYLRPRLVTNIARVP